MKCFKFCYKSKIKQETKYFHASDFKSIRYDHKTRFLEIKVQDGAESGYIKIFNLMEFDVFLYKSSDAIFPLDLFETEEEIS